MPRGKTCVLVRLACSGARGKTSVPCFAQSYYCQISVTRRKGLQVASTGSKMSWTSRQVASALVYSLSILELDFVLVLLGKGYDPLVGPRENTCPFKVSLRVHLSVCGESQWKVALILSYVEVSKVGFFFSEGIEFCRVCA